MKWLVVFVALGATLLGVVAPAPAATISVAVSPADSAVMQAAIDDQLATSGYGKLCIDGPDGFPAVVYSDDEDATMQMQIKALRDIGFVLAVSARTGADHVTATRYKLTKAGQQNYGTYRRLGFGGDYHGWCFAEYRVGRIVSSEAGPFCRQPGRLLRGFAEPDVQGVCVTIVTYLPRIISTADWMRFDQAREFPMVAGVGTFLETPSAATLAPMGGGWRAITSALDVAPP